MIRFKMDNGYVTFGDCIVGQASFFAFLITKDTLSWMVDKTRVCHNQCFFVHQYNNDRKRKT